MTMRRLTEWLLRALALALLAWGAWDLWRPAAAATTRVARVGALADALDAVVRDTSLAAVHVVVDRAPTAREAATMRALARAGVRVGWSGAVPALALAAEPLADPRGGVAVRVAGPRASVAVHDASGLVDSLHIGGAGAAMELAFAAGALAADVGAFSAGATAPDSLVLRPVLVLGAAGWEAKFVVAALEERGWRVVTRLAVAPGATVGQGDVGAIDTARYSAVVALDSTAAPYAAAIARALRTGVGVVLAGDAPRIPALASLAAGMPGKRVGARALLVSDSIGPATLAFRPLTLRPGAVELARRPGGVLAAARRVGAGRVVQTSLEESWRWRMEGGDASAGAHRDWWTRLVGGVAYAPRRTVPRTLDRLLDSTAAAAPVDAPRLRLAEALGAPSTLPRREGGSSPARRLWLLGIAALCLLLEWTSRRLRGAR